MSEQRSRPFERLEGMAAGPSGIVLIGAWALLEAIVLPVVPDVGVCLLALVAPRRAAVLFAVLVAGSLAGTAALYALAAGSPDAVTSLILAIPGIHEPMLAAARQLVASGDPLSIAQVGPGTPLKVYTLAWALGPASPVTLAAGVVLNRITRIGPGLLLVTILGWLAPGFLRRHDRLVLVAYAAFWVVLYVLYLL